MYQNIGEKLKNIATIMATLGVIVSVIGGVSLMVMLADELGGPGFFIGLVILAIGCMISWCYALLYGYGELIDNTEIMTRRLGEIRTEIKDYTHRDEDEEEKTKQVRRCKRCGTKLSEGSMFCSRCGIPANGDGTERRVVCPSCGEILPESNKFCNKCGTSVSEHQ